MKSLIAVVTAEYRLLSYTTKCKNDFYKVVNGIGYDSLARRGPYFISYALYVYLLRNIAIITIMNNDLLVSKRKQK